MENPNLIFMQEAIEQAKISSQEGNFPVGAVLVIDGELIDKGRNQLATNADWVSHAEMSLIMKNSSLIKERKNGGASVVIYTTLEPYLMCLGASSLHRISKIVYACKDNFTGATDIHIESLPNNYIELIPKFEKTDLFETESKELLLKYMNEHQSPKWDKARELMENTE